MIKKLLQNRAIELSAHGVSMILACIWLIDLYLLDYSFILSPSAPVILAAMCVVFLVAISMLFYGISRSKYFLIAYRILSVVVAAWSLTYIYGYLLNTTGYICQGIMGATIDCIERVQFFPFLILFNALSLLLLCFILLLILAFGVFDSFRRKPAKQA